MSPTISSVSVLGAGVLGSQIAFQAAIKGFPVTVYDIDDDALTTARSRFDKLAATYVKSVAGVDADATKAALDRLTPTTDLAAAAQSDLVIEAVPPAHSPPECLVAMTTVALVAVPTELAPPEPAHRYRRCWRHRILQPRWAIHTSSARRSPGRPSCAGFSAGSTTRGVPGS